ncbi:hypothetical protein AVEN_223703-1 [Araneus ventricosus]|uniref:Uncharacterized protein n=1 Tax=Araneus ventricosus TaxID=182803 RepID=A0A4Y2KM47_ARAVE|nr:hypothetical protein AVEN_223703-1 [Araneus ventricosus]
MTSKISTRNKFKCPIFGSPEDISQINLPTYKDMLRSCFFERINLAPKTGNKESSFSRIVENVATKIEFVWAKASTAIATHSRVLQIIHIYYGKYTNFKKSYKRDNTSKAFQTKINAFREEACTKLFDIAVCKCNTFEDCNCERTKKLHRNEHNFLKDQQTTRLLYIGSLDINETKPLQNIADNSDRKAHNLYLNHTQTTPNAYDPKYKYLTPLLSRSSQMRPGLLSTAVIGDKFGASDWAVAAIASSVLHYVGLITSNHSNLVVDKNKLRREKTNVRKDLKF